MSNGTPLSQAPEYTEIDSREHLAREQAELGKLKKFPELLLTEDRIDSYLSILRKLIRAGRLNSYYPNSKEQDNLYRFLTTEFDTRPEPRLRLNAVNGLPHEPEVGRVLADFVIAPRFVTHQEEDKPQDSLRKRLSKRNNYYRKLMVSRLPNRYRLELKLRHVEKDTQTAHFTIYFERFDICNGLFTRYTIRLSQQHDRWHEKPVSFVGEDLAVTYNFRNIISRYSADEAEFAFVLLSEVPNIKVQEVVRTMIGPLWTAETPNLPKPLPEFFQENPGAFILSFPLERVFVPEKEQLRYDDDKNPILEDNNSDPFARLYKESLTPESAELAKAKAQELGYVVHKERKLTTLAPHTGKLKQWLRKQNAPCIVYPAR